MATNFRDFIYPPDHPKVKGIGSISPQEYANGILSNPAVQSIASKWASNLDEPFFGITVDGNRKDDLYSLEDEGAPVENMVECANRITQLFSPDEMAMFTHGIESNNWRKWSNPEFIIYKTGVRLENLEEEKREAILKLVQSSLSESGYARIIGAMQTNEFLGDICNARSILNKYSYQFTLYGEPSISKPWGYSIFGHHLCVNIVVVGKRMTIIDSGLNAGVCLLESAGDLPLALMQSLPSELQGRTQIFKNMHDIMMPDDRWNPADQRHLGGAFQDNRIIPYEGITAEEMPRPNQEALLKVISLYLEILPPGPFQARMKQVKRHWNETYFCWIGGFGDNDAFYYRIQSPVIMIEFDHHSGVFLSNKEPAKYHIHTIMRTPNGNDYGREWIRLHAESGQK